MLLTLKNLYRMMTQVDYPIKSYRVAPERARGMTLNRFWREAFEAILPEGTDITVFDESTGRKRNLSRLMNRTGNEAFMGEWFEELGGRLDEKTVLRTIRWWHGMLTAWHAHPENLMLRLNWMSDQIAETNDLQDPEISGFLREWANKNRSKGTRCPEGYPESVLLAWMTLYALYGTRPADPALNRLRRRMNLAAEDLFFMDLQNRIRVETRGTCLLREQPLHDAAYFGYEDQLREVVRRGLDGGKICVTGPGGIGKTELVRQALRRIVEAGTVSEMLFVQYQHSLSESLAAALPAMRAIAPEKRMERLERMVAADGAASGRTLLMVDNADQSGAEDPELNRLRSLECGVIMTGRGTPPEGFEEIRLEGLDAEAGGAILARYAPETAQEPLLLSRISQTVAGHPLALTLFGRLCHSRGWSAEKLLEHIEAKGLRGLSYIGNASPVNLAEMIGRTFRTDALETEERKLLRFFALLPYRYETPETLTPLTGDIRPGGMTAEALAGRCLEMASAGWLMEQHGKFAMHPFTGEAIRLEPIHAAEFPEMWKTAGAGLERDPGTAEVLISMAIRSASLTENAARALIRLEQRAGSLSWVYIPDAVYETHRMYLEDHDRSPEGELDYQIGLQFRNLVRDGRRTAGEQDTPSITDRILELLRSVPRPKSRSALLTLLEYASATDDPDRVEAAFELLRASAETGEERAAVLTAYSVKQRRADHDPEKALESLAEAEIILRGEGKEETLLEGDLNYRRGVCLLDLGRSKEAGEALEASLRIMEALGVAGDSMKVMATRSTRAVALMFSGQNEAALAEYERLRQVYRRQGREESEEYTMMLNNMGLTMDRLGRTEEAAELFGEVNRLDALLSPPDDIVATHQRNTAHLLARLGRGAEALSHAERAVAMRKEIFGAESGWTADAEAVRAFSMVAAGDREEGRAALEKAVGRLEEAFGPTHRHTLNAKSYLARMKEGE